MRVTGSESWTITVSQWEHHLEWALWIRAAERIDVPAGGKVPGPLVIDRVPDPSVDDSSPLADGWRYWWETLLCAPELRPPITPRQIEEIQAFGAPDFDVLFDFPALQRVVRSRWEEANAWQSPRTRAGVEAFTAAHRSRRGPDQHGDGAVVRAVEQEIGRKAKPFSLKLIVLPVRDDEIRAVGDHTFLVSEDVYQSEAYNTWLYGVVRALA
jgi:hypothetical protein